MPTRHIALVPESGMNLSDLARVSAALQKQVTRDLGPVWDVCATVDPFPSVEDVTTGHWPVILTFRDLGDSAGLHIDDDGQPYALIEMSPSWSLAASHVCLEMLTDPFGRRTFTGPSPRNEHENVEFLGGICGPCEHSDFAYLINDILVSDFCTPAFWNRASPDDERKSFTGAVESAFQILPGGHLSWYDPETDSWWLRRRVDGTYRDVDLGMADVQAETIREFIARHVPALQSTRMTLEAFEARVGVQRQRAARASHARAEWLYGASAASGFPQRRRSQPPAAPGFDDASETSSTEAYRKSSALSTEAYRESSAFESHDTGKPSEGPISEGPMEDTVSLLSSSDVGRAQVLGWRPVDTDVANDDDAMVAVWADSTGREDGGIARRESARIEAAASYGSGRLPSEDEYVTVGPEDVVEGSDVEGSDVEGPNNDADPSAETTTEHARPTAGASADGVAEAAGASAGTSLTEATQALGASAETLSTGAEEASGSSSKRIPDASGASVERLAASSGVGAEGLAASSGVSAEGLAPSSGVGAEGLAASSGVSAGGLAAPSGVSAEGFAASSELSAKGVAELEPTAKGPRESPTAGVAEGLPASAEVAAEAPHARSKASLASESSTLAGRAGGGSPTRTEPTAEGSVTVPSCQEAATVPVTVATPSRREVEAARGDSPVDSFASKDAARLALAARVQAAIEARSASASSVRPTRSSVAPSIDARTSVPPTSVSTPPGSRKEAGSRNRNTIAATAALIGIAALVVMVLRNGDAADASARSVAASSPTATPAPVDSVRTAPADLGQARAVEPIQANSGDSVGAAKGDSAGTTPEALDRAKRVDPNANGSGALAHAEAAHVQRPLAPPVVTPGASAAKGTTELAHSAHRAAAGHGRLPALPADGAERFAGSAHSGASPEALSGRSRPADPSASATASSSASEFGGRL